MTDKEKIIQYLEYKGISKNKFYIATGLSVGFLDSGNSLGLDKLRIIIDKYHDLNPEWFFGTGEMIKKEEETSTVTVRKLRTDRMVDNQDIPLYDIQASAGVTELFGKNKHRQVPLDYIRIPKLPKCDGAIYITGDSMYPLLKSGDIVMYKEIIDIANNIIWGEMYLIHLIHNGDEFFFTKYVQKSEREGFVRFVSQNQHHQTVEFPHTAIRSLALVKASIRINSQL